MTRELHKSEEKVCLILDTIGDAVCGIELNGCCTFCNPAALLVLGYGRQEELLGKNLRELVHHSYGDGSPIPLESCSFFKSFTENQSYRVDDELFRRSDGSSFPVEYCSAPQLTEGRITGAVVTFMDITARKELQEKLRLKDQAKMDSITRLAAGVAHELNSPLGFISSNLRVLTDYFDQIVRYDRFRRDLDAGDSGSANRDVVAARRAELEIDSILDDGADLIGSTLGGATRVTKIVQDLQNYTRDTRLNPPEKEALTLDSCLDNALTVCLTDLNYVATIRKEYEPTPTVLGNRGQMNQLFLNLLLNAGQAMVAPGEIVLKSRFDERFVYISVSDTGAGIPEEIMNRIFDPFFTTKDVGKGTGLGLSISSEIVKKHDGELLVESVVGVGTTFTVKLPRTVEIP